LKVEKFAVFLEVRKWKVRAGVYSLFMVCLSGLFLPPGMGHPYKMQASGAFQTINIFYWQQNCMIFLFRNNSRIYTDFIGFPQFSSLYFK
jgi:hypothetical protein